MSGLKLFQPFLQTKMLKLEDGCIFSISDDNLEFNHMWLDDKYVTKLDDNMNIVLDSFNNKCYLLNNDELVGDYFPQERSDDSHVDCNSVSFILAITYKCNFRCTYCYQQHDVSLDRRLISEENLEKILAIISDYMELNPDKNVDIGLFGGEPLLPENEKAFDRVLLFCKEKRIPLHITTNGFYLRRFLKKLIINRKFISSINPTIDSTELNYLTRCSLDKSQNCSESTKELIDCIKILISYGVKVNLATNIDRLNYDKIWDMKNDLESLDLLTNPNFVWSLGRVDDRLFETGYPHILKESELIGEIMKHKLPDNMHIAFLKTTNNLVRKLGIITNQLEKKGKNNYCWNSSKEDMAFYVDNNLKTYRCTYTVGRPKYNIFDFSLDNLLKYEVQDKTSDSYKECMGCKIGGFCGGGCQLSHKVNFEKCCEYEKENFEYFIDNIFIPEVRRKYAQFC